MSARLSLNVERGSTFVKELVWKGSDGVPFDLTGWVAILQVKLKIDDALPALELSTTNNHITVNSLGQITITLSAAESRDLTFSEGTYQLELINGTYVKRLLRGSFTVDKEVVTQ